MNLFLLPVLAGQEDEDPEIALSEAVVAAQRVDIASSSQHSIQVLRAQDIDRLPVGSLSEVLQLLPGLDVRTRGGLGMQSDLSMRGGSFDQVAVLINGISLTDDHILSNVLGEPLSHPQRAPFAPDSIRLEADNLLDRRYCDYGGIVQPGRWIKAGLEYSY